MGQAQQFLGKQLDQRLRRKMPNSVIPQRHPIPTTPALRPRFGQETGVSLMPPVLFEALDTVR